MREDEKTVAVDFARLVLGEAPSAVEGRQDLPREPDAWVRTRAGVIVGVEVTSAFDEDVRRTFEHEAAFLEEIEEEVRSNALPPRLQFRLVMQDDADGVVHKPAEGMENYPTMAAWLDGLFVVRTHREPDRLVVLNQWSSSRPAVNLFPRGRYLKSLARELVSYARSLTDKNFVGILPPGESAFSFPPTHHVMTASLAALRNPCGRTGWNLASLNEKLTDPSKYKRTALAALYLLIHNYAPVSDAALRVWHVYWHNRDGILRRLASRVKVRTTPLFDDVFFLDYSRRMGGVEVYRIGSGEVLKIADRL